MNKMHIKSPKVIIFPVVNQNRWSAMGSDWIYDALFGWRTAHKN